MPTTVKDTRQDNSHKNPINFTQQQEPPHPADTHTPHTPDPPITLQDLTITFNSIKSDMPVVLEIGGRKCLGVGEMGGIVSGIGFGKSHLTEIFASLAICPGCDPLIPAKIYLQENQKAILFDTERSRDNCIDTIHRIWRRTGQNFDMLTEGADQFRQLEIITTAGLPSIIERQEKLLLCMEREDVKMIFLDGVIDFVHDANDADRSGKFAQWLFAQAIKTETTILFTIHGNRGDDSGRAKGHLGEIMQRKSTAFFMLKRHPNNPKMRVLTLGFENNKVRDDDDSELNIAMAWNSKIGAFSGVEYAEDGGINLESMIEKLFFGRKTDLLTYSDLLECVKVKVSKATFDRRLKTWLAAKDKFLTKQKSSGLYKLS